MDGRLLDQLAKSIGAGHSRRRMLRLAAGGLGAALFGTTRGSTGAQEFCNLLDEPCDLGDDCCEGLVCTAGLTCADTCSGVDGGCVDAGDCCIELACAPSGVCYDPNCGTVDDFCNPENAGVQLCCPGFFCHPAGRCVPDGTSSCSVLNELCPTRTECCDGLFCHPQTITCIERGGPGACFDDTDCADNEACDPTGFCKLGPGFCSNEDGPCSSHYECCGLLLCNDYGDGSGYCGGTACSEEAAFCGTLQGFYPCCEGMICLDNVCRACAGDAEACGGGGLGCCEGLACSADDVCEAVAPAAECEDDGDCDDGEICCAEACRSLECCIDDVLSGGNPNDRCADGTTCFEGQCVFACKGDGDCADGACCCGDGTCYAECCGSGVTTLPSSGIGEGGLDATGLFGLGLAAGAVAYFTGKHLRVKEAAEGD